jgi:4-hydroxy-tetrahydrodipicolinate synthase
VRVELTDLRSHLSGVAAVAITPMTADLEIDHDGLRRVVRHLDDCGVDTIVACGGTAEYYALTPDERRDTALAIIDETHTSPVIVSVGLDAAGAATAARQAQRDGAAGIMIHQPIHPYLHEDGLSSYYQSICSAVSIGVVVYVRDPAVSVGFLEKLVQIPNVVGVKYAVNDVRAFGGIVAQLEGADVTWVCGSAEAWGPFFWVAGATGFTSGIANFAAPESLALRDALRAGDVERVRTAWKRVQPVEELRSRWRDANNIAGLKAGAALCGLAGEAIRPPLRPLPPAEKEELADILRDWGVVER